MAEVRPNGPYIWVTWLTRLLVGEQSCEWASWFRSQHRNWQKVADGFSPVLWQMRHTALIHECRQRWEDGGYTVLTESQNSFALRGRAATLGGKPDLIARQGGQGTIIDVKTGQPRASDSIQVMLYMYAIPRALRQHAGVEFDGVVQYPDHRLEIPASAVDASFVDVVGRLVRRLADQTPARRVPSPQECRFCPIGARDCGERVEVEQTSIPVSA